MSIKLKTGVAVMLYRCTHSARIFVDHIRRPYIAHFEIISAGAVPFS